MPRQKPFYNLNFYFSSTKIAPKIEFSKTQIIFVVYDDEGVEIKLMRLDPSYTHTP